MSITLSELASRTRSLSVPYPTDQGTVEIAVKYRIGERTAESLDRDTPEDPWLLRALVEWDITEDDGEPLPITRENLSMLPGGGRPLIRAIIEDDFAGEAPSS